MISQSWYCYALVKVRRKNWLIERSSEQHHAEVNLLRSLRFRRLKRVSSILVVRARRHPEHGHLELSCARPCRHCSIVLHHYAKVHCEHTGIPLRVRFSTGLIEHPISEPYMTEHLREGSVVSSGYRRRYIRT